MSEPAITLADPSGVRAGRVETEAGDRILLTWEFVYEGEEQELAVALTTSAFAAMVVAGLNGLGFPESDLTYIAERLERIE